VDVIIGSCQSDILHVTSKTYNGNAVTHYIISYIEFKETVIVKRGLLHDTLTDFRVSAKEIGLKMKADMKLNVGCL
jgi:hypothetical protein